MIAERASSRRSKEAAGPDRRRPWKIALAALGLAALMAAAAPAPASARPDLALVSAKLTGRDYAFKDEPFTFRFEARTRNIGSDRAPRSRTRLWLVPPRGAPLFILQIQVPSLGRRESYATTATMRRTFNVPLGAYDVRICVDRRYSTNVRNDCRTLRKSFFVVARTWKVVVDGEGPVLGSNEITERWSVADSSSFNFTMSFRRGAFQYALLGAATYRVSGVVNQCNYSGGGVSGALQGQLNINYIVGEYSAIGGAPVFSFPIVRDCDPDPLPGPTWPNVIDTGFGRTAQPRVGFNQTILYASYADDMSGYKNTWSIIFNRR